jgi:hypothetical protein
MEWKSDDGLTCGGLTFEPLHSLTVRGRLRRYASQHKGIGPTKDAGIAMPAGPGVHVMWAQFKIDEVLVCSNQQF